MRKEAVLFLSHVYNDYTLMRFRQLQTSVIEGQDLIWVHTNFDGIYFFSTHKEINHLYIKLRNNYIFKQNNSAPNNSYLFVDIFEKIPNYDYYWFIEYDVCINSKESDPYRRIFDYYVDNDNYECDADVIADHIATYNTNHNYNIRYPFKDLLEQYEDIQKLYLQKNDIHFGFYTICRLSNKLLKNLKEIPEWQNIFFEIGITTFAYKCNYKICTFQNLFSWRGNTKFDNPHRRLNVGSNGFLKKVYQDYYDEFPEGAIIHAVKNYE